MSVSRNDIYDCPIHEQIGELKMMLADEHDRTLIKAVQQIGIEIDQESLVQAIQNDRQRYEEAYKKGYSDCQKEYEKKKMKQIASITGYLTSNFLKDKE